MKVVNETPQNSTIEPDVKKRKLIVAEKELTKNYIQFDGSHFRKIIKGDHPLGGVRQLLAVTKNSNKNIINEYLFAGGNVLELVLVLDKIESKTYFHQYLPVFSLISIIITKCRDELPQLLPSTEEACKRVLRSHTATLHSMLASNSTQSHKKVVLEMLTGMVTLSQSLAREMLSTLSLREVTINDLAKQSGRCEPNGVRAYFTRYILAYFYHDSIHLVKQLLDQRHLLQSIILAGLTTDDAPLLSLLLTNLKERIVENTTISKTTKLKMFNTKIMIKLLEALLWTGPSIEKNPKKEEVVVTTSKEDKDEIVNQLYHLLVLLCTNHKLGVAFIDPTVGLDQNKNYNELVFSVIKSMDPIWNVKLVRELAVKIVSACPDLIAPTFRHFGLQECFHPLVSLSFIQTCEFAKQVIDNLDAERCLGTSTCPDHLTHLTTRVVFNMNVLNCVRTSLPAIHPTLRLQAINLLNSAFQAFHGFTQTVKLRFSRVPRNFIDYEQRMIDHITKNIGVEEELMVAWSLGVDGDQSLLAVPTETEYYLPLVDLLLTYQHLFPVYLPPVFIARLQNTALNTLDTHSKHLFDVKIIKFIIIFKSIQPSQNEFSEMISTLVPLLPECAEAKGVLNSLMLQTAFFEGVEPEVDIWVTNLALFSDHLPVMLATLTEAVINSKKCIKMIQECSGCSYSFEESVEFNWNDLIKVAKNPGHQFENSSKMLPNARISIIVPALIRVLNSGKYDNVCSSRFISHILGDILFNQVELSSFQKLVESCTSPLAGPVKKYLSGLIGGAASIIMSDVPFSKKSPEYNLLKTLSSPIFSKDVLLKLVSELEPQTTALLGRLAVFHAILASTAELVSRCATVLRTLPQSLTTLTELYSHPLVLYHFHPLQSSSPPNTSPLVLTASDLINLEHQWLLKPYKQRFLESIEKAIRKGKKTKCNDLPELCKKLISEKEEIIAVLSTIIDHQPRLERYTGVACSMVEAATIHYCPLPASVVMALSQHSSLHGHLALYLTHFPHLTAFIQTDHLTGKQEELGNLCRFILKFDSDGTVQRKLLKNNRKRLHILLPALAEARLHSDSQLIEQASQLVGQLCTLLHSASLPTWLSETAPNLDRFFAQLSVDQCEQLYVCLNDLAWSKPHLDIAKYVYIRVGHLPDFVVKVLSMLMPLTSSSTLPRAEEICNILLEVVGAVELLEYNWDKVLSSEDWAKWTRLALRLGETLDGDHSFLLTTLSALSTHVYSQKKDGVSVVLEMVFSHSQFLSVMLAKPTRTKNALLNLILTLLRLDSSLMETKHVPIFLSAYSASLSSADQILLQLLQLYESEGVSLGEWRPLLWGEPAAVYYSVRSQAAPGLWNKQSFSQLLDLFDEHRVNLTITHFPVNRPLKPQENIIEQADVYDPAFYLPMLASMFAPSEVFFSYKTCQSGCLSLVLSALASCQKAVRTIAYVALQRFHCHLLSNTSNQDTLWLHFLNALRFGLGEGEADVPRLNSITAVFLARTVLVLTNPSHPLYLPLSQFVLAKPRFELDTVPEMLPLFNSVDVQLHNVHQEWILAVLRDGMRESEDFNVCLKGMVFKVILEYYNSILASEKSKILILEVLQAAVSVELHPGHSGGMLLLASYSLYPWLHCAVSELTLPPTLLTTLISVVNGLLHPSSASQLVPLLCQLTVKQPHLSESQLTQVLAALCPHPLSLHTVNHLIDTAEVTVGDVHYLRTILDNGVKYVEKHSQESNDVRGYLKEIIVKFLTS